MESGHMSTNPSASNLTMALSQKPIKNKTNSNKRRGGKKVQEKERRRLEHDCSINGPTADHLSQAERPFFELRDAGPKGLGLFATRNILPGQLILQESPLFVIPRGEEEDMAEDAMTSFQNLTPANQNLFLGLSSCFQEETMLNEAVAAASSETPSIIDDKADSLVVEDQPVLGFCDSHCIFEASCSPAGCSDSGCGVLSVCKSPNGDVETVDHSSGTEFMTSTASQTDSANASSVEGETASSTESINPSCHRDENVVLDSATSTEADAASTPADVQTKRSEASPSIDLKELETLNINDNRFNEYRSNEVSQSARIINIWKTNSYGLDDGVHLDTAGISPTTARLNHSCNPNVYCAFNSDTNMLTVHATRPIAENEQFFTSYIQSSDMLRSERQASLLNWDFLCDCPACTSTDNKHNHQTIKALGHKTAEAKTKFYQLRPQELAQTAHDLLHMATLMIKEGFINPNSADVYLGAELCYTRLGIQKPAQELRDKRLELMKICYGIDSPAFVSNAS